MHPFALCTLNDQQSCLSHKNMSYLESNMRSTFTFDLMIIWKMWSCGTLYSKAVFLSFVPQSTLFWMFLMQLCSKHTQVRISNLTPMVIEAWHVWVGWDWKTAGQKAVGPRVKKTLLEYCRFCLMWHQGTFWKQTSKQDFKVGTFPLRVVTELSVFANFK